jgi:outer membrane lipoprotein-sorting protein
VPVLTAGAVGLAAFLPTSASASAHPVLPARSAAQLLAAVQASQVTALSGTIVETARLGLPELPGANDAGILSLQTLVSGTHTARIWFDGPDRQRLALLGQLSESDVVHNGRDIWTYASSTQKVGHTTLPADRPAAAKPDPTSPSDLRRYGPQGAAQQALAAIDPSTQVTVDRTARVAGRAAYTLVLAPRDPSSTIRRVLIAMDAKTSAPLRVQVFGTAARPAFEIGFTDVSFSRPAASVFHFSPPKGSTVTPDLLPGTGRHQAAQVPDAVASPHSDPTVLGAGWTSVLELPATAPGASPLASLTGSDRSSALVDRLLTTLPNGDKLLRSALINVLQTKDGRTFVGAVIPTVLEQAAAGHTG